MDLVDEDYLAIALAEFVFGVHEDEALLCGNLSSALEKGAGIFLHGLVVFLVHDALGDDLFLADVLVMSFICLCGGGDDGLGETLVLTHAFGKLHATDLAASVLIVAPCRTGQIATDNHFHTETFCLQTYGYHGVGGGKFPVGNDVGCGIQERCCNLVEYLSLERNAFGENYVEC